MRRLLVIVMGLLTVWSGILIPPDRFRPSRSRSSALGPSDSPAGRGASRDAQTRRSGTCHHALSAATIIALRTALSGMRV